jgi:hypothetical protein
LDETAVGRRTPEASRAHPREDAEVTVHVLFASAESHHRMTKPEDAGERLGGQSRLLQACTPELPFPETRRGRHVAGREPALPTDEFPDRPLHRRDRRQAIRETLAEDLGLPLDRRPPTDGPHQFIRGRSQHGPNRHEPVVEP